MGNKVDWNIKIEGLKFRVMDKTSTIYGNKRIKIWRKKKEIENNIL